MRKSLFFIASGIYIGIVIWLLFFYPFNPASRMDTSAQRFISLTPFGTTSEYLLNALEHQSYGHIRTLLINVGGNILLFVPMGVIIFNASPQRIWIPWLLGFLISLSVETIQITTQVGNFDVDDILFNSLGTLLGYWLCAHVPVLQLHKLS
ncbi:VanZ family protein [Catalinimonas niigatensis]|uniref:VanZ family protein n=1 Tax=Catalinimonas niigatensis TaxID=1397264 RepID=UPI002665E180|nr:VanZ family protein [Catalinimonas niigatensis]WPP52918.1 VanZ family protein [Catalinimonas niigatensis]